MFHFFGNLLRLNMAEEVRFFDNRQRYLLFVTTTNEKAVIAEKLSHIINELKPIKPALKIFDAGVGDGAVLMNVLRIAHQKFPTVPFYVSCKDVSMEDARITIEKLADRFVEHPNMVFTISNLHYSEAGYLKSNNESKQQNMNWSSIALDGDSSFGFYEQLRQLGPLLKENWRVEENKQGNTTYENPSVICIYRKDHEFTLDQIIPSKNESINEFDLVIVSQAYRSRASVEKKVNNVIKPMVSLLAPNGKMVAFHSYGNDPGLNAINQLWPDENPFPNKGHDIIQYMKNNLGNELNGKIHFREPEIFEYKLRSQPNEINSGIATSLVFSAWNACTYVAQISDQMVKEKEADQSYIKCIEDIIRDHDGLWFYDEMLVADRK